jgi:hypothetical protein
MHNRFDQLAKQIGREALGRSGATVVHHEISPETQHADLRHEPDPACGAERERLGLLGRLASVVCLIEIYGHAPSAEEFRACLSKHLASWQERTRNTRADNQTRRKKRQPPRPFIEPFLWIIAAGAPMKVLTELKIEAAPGWPAGVYGFGAGVLRVGIVVASELPPDRSTLLVRLMAAGPLLARAIEELIALSPDAHERVVAEQILLRLQHALRQKSSRNREEQEFIVTMYKTWEDARIEAQAKGRAEGLAKGRAEVRAETQANAVLTALRVRGITVSVAARKRILAEKDLKQLERWFEKAIVATSIDQVIGASRARSARSARSAHHVERGAPRSRSTSKVSRKRLAVI